MISGDGQTEKAGPDSPDAGWFGLAPEQARSAGGPFVGVVVNRPIDQVLTYRIPARLGKVIRRGQRVKVPLGRGNKLAIGYCVEVDVPAPEGFDPRKLKDVAEILDPVPLIDDRMLELTRWMAEYYVCSWGQALDTAVPAGGRNQAGGREGTFLLVPEEVRQALKDQTLKPGLSPKRAAALEVLCRSDEPLTISDVCRRAKCASAPVLALRRQNLVHSVRRRLSFAREGVMPASRATSGIDEAGNAATAPNPVGTPSRPARMMLTDEQ